MARVLFFAFLAMCLVYVMQASPTPEESQPPPKQSNPLDDLQAVFNSALNSTKQGFDAIKNNPDVQKIINDASTSLQQFAETIKTKVEELIPKTQETS